MKRLLTGFAFLVALTALTSDTSARAQYVGFYAPPVVYPVVRPVYVPRPAPIYYPAPVAVYRPYVAPVIAPRPRYRYYTPYGGYEVRVPGRPVANTIRTIVR